MSLDSLSKEDKDKLGKEINAELKYTAELMRAQNMRLRRNMDRDFNGFRGDETIKDFEKHLKELGEELRTKTPEGNMWIVGFVGFFIMFFGILTLTAPVVMWSIGMLLFIYAGVTHKRNEKIASKENRITYIKTRIKELKENGEK